MLRAQLLKGADKVLVVPPQLMPVGQKLEWSIPAIHLRHAYISPKKGGEKKPHSEVVNVQVHNASANKSVQHLVQLVSCSLHLFLNPSWVL